MGPNKGLVSRESFQSFQLVELSNLTINQRNKHIHWYNAVRDGFKRLNNSELEQLLNAAMLDKDNTKSLVELQAALVSFMGEK